MPRRLVTAQRVLIWRIGELVFVLALCGVVVFLSTVIQDVRRQIIQSQLQAERELEGVGAIVVLEVELDQRQVDLEQIVAYIPDKAGIGGVVAALEGEAVRHDVALKIPVVQEAENGDGRRDGSRTESSLKVVQLQVVVSGTPEAALRFFHAVEYLPYLLEVGQWRFDVTTTVAPGSISTMPIGGPGAAQEGVSVAKSQLTDLTLDLFLTIHEADDESRS